MGANGFIPKTLPLKTVAHALRFIAAGEVYVPADVLLRMRTRDDGGLGLKPREMRVLGFLNEGMQNKEIGREIGVEETIVKMDVKSICRKLGVRNRTQAVLAARKHGVV
jgi:DNA-binding NarL/FixJ family response regulator